MANILIVFQKPETGRNIRNLLVRSGFSVGPVCVSGAQVLAAMEDYVDGIVICGHRLPDMMYTDLLALLPEGFQMVMIASPAYCGDHTDDRLLCMPVPLKAQVFTETVGDILEAQARRKRRRKAKPRVRSSEEMEDISRAKQVLMNKKGMTEEEAHRYLQKTSMDTGTNMHEAAQMVLAMDGTPKD